MGVHQSGTPRVFLFMCGPPLWGKCIHEYLVGCHLCLSHVHTFPEHSTVPAASLSPGQQCVSSVPHSSATASSDVVHPSLANNLLVLRFQGIMPGGVSSPVRAFKSVGGNPIVFDRVKGAYAWDVDG